MSEHHSGCWCHTVVFEFGPNYSGTNTSNRPPTFKLSPTFKVVANIDDVGVQRVANFMTGGVREFNDLGVISCEF